MWHSIRRKWATEQKGYPVRDVMEAGGGKNEETLLRSYQQPDADTGEASGVASDAANCEPAESGQPVVTTRCSGHRCCES